MLGADCPHAFTPAGLDPLWSPQSRMREGGEIPHNPEEEVVDASHCACSQQPLLSALAPCR